MTSRAPTAAAKATPLCVGPHDMASPWMTTAGQSIRPRAAVKSGMLSRPIASVASMSVRGVLTGETHQRTDRAAALARLAWLEAREGKEEACTGHAGDALRLADELGLTLCRLWALSALGDLHFAHGQAAEAITILEQQLALLEEAAVTDVDLSPAPELVELHLRQGEAEAASALAAEYQRQAEAKGQPWALARAARCRALLADPGDIDAPLREALAAHARTLDFFETARTRLAYGSRLRRARQRVLAREQLQAAIDVFDTLGATPWSATARGELAATGAVGRARDDSTRYQLTPQELQIALLLAAGHTTKQAAAALFLSPRRSNTTCAASTGSSGATPVKP